MKTTIQAFGSYQGREVAIIETHAPAYRNYKVSYAIIIEHGVCWVNADEVSDIRWVVAA
jgi:hypothetical protein